MIYLQLFLMGFGVYATFLWAYNTFLESLLGIIWGTVRSWFRYKPLTERYGPWAVITGATDGIGKRYAEILASKGMHIMLLSRNEAKLMKVANEIYERYNVQTKWLAVDFSQGPEIYKMIREHIEGLDIGILVNNVGYYPEVRSFDRNTEEEIISTININILSTTMLTRIVLPGMKQRKRGIIVNISSIGCYRPAAYLNMYASAKAFVTNFSLALNHELRGKGVKCQAVVPGMTHTNMIAHLEEDIPWYVGVTTVDALAKFGVFSLGKTAHTTGGWKHTLQICWQDLLPYSLGTIIISYVTKKAIVITGATDGIGKRYAEILASNGMNIVLVSRSEPKLMKVANEIYERYNVQTRWVAVDFSRGPEIYKMIKEQIESLDIGILVNNVGYYPTVRTFDLNSDDEIISTININILSTSMMSRIVLPGMKYRKRGIIVNISSTSCYRPAAYLNMYASAKAFVTNFSLALHHELRGSGVECQVVTPGMVHTNMIKKFEGDVPWYISVTTSDSLAKFGVFSLGKTAHTTGGWMHAFQVSWQDLLPLSLGTFFISLITKKAVGK